MKKIFATITLVLMFLLAPLYMAAAQETPQPNKDTVNMDTDAKPTFYYAVEDEESASDQKAGGSGTTVGIIVAVVAVAVVAGYFLLRKKKDK